MPVVFKMSFSSPVFDPSSIPGKRDSRRGAILIFVLLMIVMASTAMVLFIERSQLEIRTETLHWQRDSLRADAYSSLDVVLAVLEDVVQIDGALRDPSQGWMQPFAYADWPMPAGLQVEVQFTDESGKLSLATMRPEEMERLFEHLGFDLGVREDLTDAFFAWIKEDFQPRGTGMTREVYSLRELPHRPGFRPIRSYREIFAIEGFRRAFQDDDGLPDERFARFQQLTTLVPVERINVNAMNPEILPIVLGEMNNLATFQGEDFRNQRPEGRNWFESPGEASGLWGVDLPGDRFHAEIEALTVNLRILLGNQEKRLRVTLTTRDFSPDGGAPQGRERRQREGSEANSTEARQIGSFFIWKIEEA